MDSAQRALLGDTREDRAKRVALSYRRRLAEIDPGSVAQLDAHWREHGAGWVEPAQTPLRLDDWHAAGEMSELLHINARALRDWARRHPYQFRLMHDARGRRLYCVGDVVEYMRKARLRRVSSTMSA